MVRDVLGDRAEQLASQAPASTRPHHQLARPLADLDQHRARSTQAILALGDHAGLDFSYKIDVINPLFAAVVDRLSDDGGGGLVEERVAQANRGLRLTLWMSLDGSVIRPRQDLNPYIQLDVDAKHRQVSVWEGDMWRGQGASRPTSTLTLEQLTSQVLLDRVARVVSRATAHTRRMAAIWNGENV